MSWHHSRVLHAKLCELSECVPVCLEALWMDFCHMWNHIGLCSYLEFFLSCLSKTSCKCVIVSCECSGCLVLECMSCNKKEGRYPYIAFCLYLQDALHCIMFSPRGWAECLQSILTWSVLQELWNVNLQTTVFIFLGYYRQSSTRSRLFL